MYKRKLYRPQKEESNKERKEKWEEREIQYYNITKKNFEKI